MSPMNPLPLPSLVHYELLLQLLERKTLSIAYEKPALQDQVQQLIVSLRKARAQQKQLEAICQQTHIPVEHHWSLNSIDANSESGEPPLNSPETLGE
ncbi:DUF5340 domain-containing protein [Aphanothece sacrum]|uniref:DUF5340 domain-containing protein n=1 Tax=Aphanothece sacrum FPU1 TaxID=1920663 RepID=A0A401IGK1_APHSA|nr:DUF5340 domain-containing protein [Aphanothece sacrum]GBF80349.1 hypothetical protein AsFPU1_1750 [Aphanothece sacrum FPU1]GBF83756.1 hypothetical protein AsFPU3_0799 [Aphanothece sacrum FPU3]